MTSISILGTGNMGSAIQAVAERGGHEVQLLGSADQDTAVTGDIVVLAVPHPAVDDIIATRGEQLAGKIVVDAMNYWWESDGLDSPLASAEPSSSELVVQHLNTSRLVKGFNHIGYHDIAGEARAEGSPDRIAMAMAWRSCGSPSSTTRRG